ncbi:MAG: hypothetical protein NVSMB49_04850 [Ktedonobacteraceae bacterium]
MNGEHVEDFLSAYLDNALTQEECARVTAHVQTCATCNDMLKDLRYFDALLRKQPRVSPSETLRERIFSSPEYKALIDDIPKRFTDFESVDDIKNRQTMPQKRVRFHDISHPRLVAIPGKLPTSSSPLDEQETKARIRIPQRRGIQLQRFMQVMIAACLFLTVGVGSFIGWNLWQAQGKTAQDMPSITPPQDPRQGGPLPAGTRFVFLSDGGLWSGPEDGSTPAVRLTPASVTVGSHWVVSPALLGHAAGNLLAYVDVKQGHIHIIRTDGQSDTVVQQPLLRTASAATWSTHLGSTILNSLSWSPDGHTLAFIAAPTGTPALYMDSTSTNQVQNVALPNNGSVSSIVWSPDGVRIAFNVAHNSILSILDYNTVTHEVMTVAPMVTTFRYPNDTVLSLNWAPANDAPAITWSVGVPGHVHSIWLRHVDDTSRVYGAQLLSSEEFTEAVYSRTGEDGIGSWLLCRALSANTNTLLTLALTGTFRRLANGHQIDIVQWTPDGKHVTYFDTIASGVGAFQSIDITTGVTTLIASNVHSIPMPTWSLDGQYLLYSAGTQSFVTDTQHTKQLPLQGAISTFTWSPTSPHDIIVAIQGRTQGVYLVDMQRYTAKSLSTKSAIGSIVWTQIP